MFFAEPFKANSKLKLFRPWFCLFKTFLIIPIQMVLLFLIENKHIKSKTHFNYCRARANFAGDKAPGTQRRWTPLKTEENFETLVKIDWMLGARNFSATGIKSWTDTLCLHWNATSFFRVENWIRIFTLSYVIWGLGGNVKLRYVINEVGIAMFYYYHYLYGVDLSKSSQKAA